MILRETHNVPAEISPIRLSDYAVNIFSVLPSRAGMRKAIKKGWVKVNGNVASTGLHISGGETIELFETESNPIRPRPKLELNVLFEDDHIAAISKPAGVLVSGNKHKTIDKALPQNLQASSLNDALSNPHPAHRLDFPTSGILLVGKTQTALTALNKQFENKEIQKTYYAVTLGKIPSEGTFNDPIDDKPAQTRFQVIKTVSSEKHGQLNLMQLSPLTGRRHQLRIHLANAGHPIIGDQDYGTESTKIGQGLYLHAGTLDFVHPITKTRIHIEDPLPKKFRRMFELPL